MQKYKSISELTSSIRETLQTNFDAITVEGEISNYKAHVSGHWYFTLKDSDAQISCAMWRGFNNYVFFTPEDGMKVTVNGKISVYPPRGTYQIDVRSMKPAGVGELQAAFERLKQKLSAEGLFDEELKKPIPRFPNKIGIITGADSAAMRDMINIAERRYPIAELVIAETQVQGEGAADKISKLVSEFNKLSDIDVLIVSRGGGSLEDLWAFNEEKVARAIFDSNIPVISGVGHEIDFTIADFVSDLRAPTPSAAMELATPSRDELMEILNNYSIELEETILNKIESENDSVKELLNSYGFRKLETDLQNRVQFVDNLYSQLNKNINSVLRNNSYKIDGLQKLLQGYDVEKTLKKGFTLIKQNGKFVPRAKELNKESEFSIKFTDDEVKVKNG